MTSVVSTNSNAPFKRYVRANGRKIGLVPDIREATRFNHQELVRMLARVYSLLPSCYFEYEELGPLADDGERQACERPTRLASHRLARVRSAQKPSLSSAVTCRLPGL